MAIFRSLFGKSAPAQAKGDVPLLQQPFIPILKAPSELAAIEEKMKTIKDPAALDGVPFSHMVRWSEGELALTFGVDHPHSVQMISRADCRKTDGSFVSVDDLMPEALKNLFTRFGGSLDVRSDKEGHCHLVQGFGGYVTSMIFLPQLFELADQMKFKGAPFVALPCRDKLILADSGGKPDLSRLSATVAEIQAHPDSNRPLTRAIFRLEQDGAPARIA